MKGSCLGQAASTTPTRGQRPLKDRSALSATSFLSTATQHSPNSLLWLIFSHAGFSRKTTEQSTNTTTPWPHLLTSKKDFFVLPLNLPYCVPRWSHSREWRCLVLFVCFPVFIFIFLAVPHGTWDLRSPSGDQTCTPCSGSLKS